MDDMTRGHKPRTPGAHRSRRWFMNRAMLTGGVSAVAVMGGYAASSAGAETTSSTDATASASPSGAPTGAPPGGGGQTVAYDDFVGVTTDGTVVDDLYAIHSTHVSTVPVVRAAKAFVDALTDDQKSATLFDVDSDQWLDWTNVDSNNRDGVALRDLTEKQYALGMRLLKASLSARGLKQSNQIRKINQFLGEYTGDTSKALNEDAYWFTIMGTPSVTEAWGFQFEGHHLVINYFVLGDQVVMTPTFMGSEPTKITYDGVDYHLFKEETAAGLRLLRSLNDTQLAAALSTAAKTGEDLIAGAGKDNGVIPYAGLKGSALTGRRQEQLLLDLVEVYVGNMDEGHAQVKMREVEKHLDDTYFYWMGEYEDDSAFYYRVHSPVILIEYDAEHALAYHGDKDTSSASATASASASASASAGPGPGGGSQGDPTPTTQHIHTIVRTPNGNDYGVDLLKLHRDTDH
ncbi:DUF3500 domain-containing protein [Streptomyces fulvoviolaceus]|uniref:DUF3500 domain-containing protein n=1 Tax=Streptomyces fulvoviolaceus TaxID=285535 RepID=UPI001F3D257B|nr:DUF3500 domain-containing protein [Streptomyces fulvoviolaceus]